MIPCQHSVPRPVQATVFVKVTCIREGTVRKILKLGSKTQAELPFAVHHAEAGNLHDVEQQRSSILALHPSSGFTYSDFKAHLSVFFVWI